MKIEELCQKQVYDIKGTGGSIIAITKSGQIYSWDLNTYGLLGNGTKDNSAKPINSNSFKNFI